MPKILLGPEQLATTTAPGLMSAADKNKLDTVASDSNGNEYIKGTLYVNCDSNFANGTSIVKATDYASTEDAGVIKIGGGLFIDNLTHKVSPEKANDSQIKAGSAQYRPIVPEIQHKSVFYGLAKAAGADEKNSTLPLGTYSDNAKAAIQRMLDVPSVAEAGTVVTENVSGATPVIEAAEGHRYVCGEVTSINFTPSTYGLCELMFTSGSTVAVLTLPNTVKMPEWFEVETERVYDIIITDGVYGAVTSWAM